MAAAAATATAAAESILCNGDDHIEAEYVEGRCCICYERKSSVVLKPCGHREFCAECMYADCSDLTAEDVRAVRDQIKKCPICNVDFTEALYVQ